MEPPEFYVCSFGGSGSWMLAQYLSRYGEVTHVHSRNPPATLQRADRQTEHFTTEFKSPRRVHVVYVFREPVKAMYSVERRHSMKTHCINIECNSANTFGMSLLNEDVFRLEEFFDNYTTPKERNYAITCVKYETMLANMRQLNAALGIRDDPTTYPTFTETSVPVPDLSCYDALRAKMNAAPPVFIV